jgi:hypothetical protein
MITIEEMEEMLEKIAAGLPEDFFRELNGGIILLPESKLHQKSVGNDLFILGEYRRDVNLGKYIAIFYGSFMRVYGHLSLPEFMEKLESTVKHEFRHHLEYMAGEYGLEVEDARRIAEYQSRKNRKKKKE